jgi:hypothetical protein
VTTMFYFLSFLDRSNVGNAKVSGLMRDLGINNHQYQVLDPLTSGLAFH